MQAFERAAGPEPSPFVDRFWAIRAGPGEEVSLADPLPGTGAELLIHCGAPLRRADETELPSAHLLCLRRGPLRLAPAFRGLDLFAIRFRAGAVRHFVEPEPAEIADVLVPFPDLAGPLARSLCDQVANARGFQERVGSAELALGELLRPRGPGSDRAATRGAPAGHGRQVPFLQALPPPLMQLAWGGATEAPAGRSESCRSWWHSWK